VGAKQTHRGNHETPVVFPAFPWLIDGNKYEAYLESALAHVKAQECPEAEILPPFLTDAYDPPVEFTKKTQMIYVTPKLNEIIEKFLEVDATHLWFLNADQEVPPDALCKLLELDVDIASGVSPPRSNIRRSTVMRWMPPPSPEYPWSKSWYKSYWMKDVVGKIMGGDEILVTGHFCMLCKRRVFEQFSPSFEPLRFRYDPPQTWGSEQGFWYEAQELGFICRIHGDILCGHLPNFPLEMVKEAYNVQT